MSLIMVIINSQIRSLIILHRHLCIFIYWLTSGVHKSRIVRTLMCLTSFCIQDGPPCFLVVFTSLCKNTVACLNDVFYKSCKHIIEIY